MECGISNVCKCVYVVERMYVLRQNEKQSSCCGGSLVGHQHLKETQVTSTHQQQSSTQGPHGCDNI